MAPSCSTHSYSCSTWKSGRASKDVGLEEIRIPPDAVAGCVEEHLGAMEEIRIPPGAASGGRGTLPRGGEEPGEYGGVGEVVISWDLDRGYR